MKKRVANGVERNSLEVLDSPQGKLIVYLTSLVPDLGDCFTTIIPWTAIEGLEERSKDKVFTWTMRNGCFAVQGREDRWTLAFRMNRPSHRMVPVFLSPDETESIKVHLFARLQ